MTATLKYGFIFRGTAQAPTAESVDDTDGSPEVEPPTKDHSPDCSPEVNHSPCCDIGLKVTSKSQLSDNDKYRLLINHWEPEASHKFSSQMEYGRSRSFQHSWLKKYKGLVFSPSLNGGICIYCALFSKSKEAANAVLVGKPYTKNYHKASDILGDHFIGKDGKGKSHHFAARECAETFASVMAGVQQPVHLQLNNDARERVEQNRLKLTSIVKSVVFCGKQNIPLRGHRDDSQHLDNPKHNPGNFQKLLEFRIDAGDEVLRQHFLTADKRSTYRSKTTQNELINICGDYITDTLCEEIRQAKFYSISADEVADQANHEQLSLVLRFVDANNDIRTEFMGFLYCESTTGEALANKIMDKLEQLNIPIGDCRGQTYDGAGNMSGTQRGVAARILAINDKAVFTHCASHRLNLAVVKAISLQDSRNMMDIADKIVRFYNYSPKRQLNLESSIENIHEGENQKVKKLKEMCKTRWVQRHDALDIFVKLYVCIANSLEDISSNPREWNASSVSDATSFLIAMTRFQFIAALHTTRSILAYVQPLSTSLQSNTKDMIKAKAEIDHIINALEEQRLNIDTFHRQLFAEMTATADAVNVVAAAPRSVNRQRHRANAPAETVEEYYRRNCCIPMLDQFIESLRFRFGQRQQEYLQALNIIPSVISASDRLEVEQNVRAFSDSHRDDLPSPGNMDAELHVWITRWKGANIVDPPKTAAAALKATDPAFFPNIHTMLKLLCTTAVTSCECERSISALRRLETYLRTTMSQERINGLALMHVHYGIDVNIEWVIDEFARRNTRRMQLVNILAD